jgi:hypothetical protein
VGFGAGRWVGEWVPAWAHSYAHVRNYNDDGVMIVDEGAEA